MIYGPPPFLLRKEREKVVNVIRLSTPLIKFIAKTAHGQELFFLSEEETVHYRVSGVVFIEWIRQRLETDLVSTLKSVCLSLNSFDNH